MLGVDVRQIGWSDRWWRNAHHGVDDSVQIEIHGDVVGEVPGYDCEDGPTMETARMRETGSDGTRWTSNIASNLVVRFLEIVHEVNAEVGVDAHGDDGDGRLNPI
jgi:hypothetical protein